MLLKLVQKWFISSFVLLIWFLSTTSVLAKIILPKYPGLPSIDELAREGGVEVEHREVTTADGYILLYHRLGNSTGPPVLVQHGFLQAADIWLSRGRREDLVFLLLDAGYDVYLGNLRGSVFSKRHVSLKAKDPRFWDFTFHESGYYDMPAVIDSILESRGVDQLYYIGHSLGTTVFFIMCSDRPEYNAKIRAAALVSPVAHVPDPSEFAIPFVRLSIAWSQTILRGLTAAGIFELLPRRASQIRAAHEVCGYRVPSQDYCLDLMGIYVGEHRSNLDRKHFSRFLSFSPAGSSVQTLHHLAQIYRTAEFDHLDHGPIGNLRLYNSTTPPTYRLELVTAPVGLFWSWNDQLVSQRSVQRTKRRLANVVLDRVNPDPKFNHADIYVGLNAKEVLYDEILAFLNQFR